MSQFFKRFGDNTPYQIKHAFADVAAAAATEVVPLVAGRRLVVVGISLTNVAQMNTRIVSTTGTPVDLTALKHLPVDGVWREGVPAGGAEEIADPGAVGQNIGVENSDAGAAGVDIWYIEV